MSIFYAIQDVPIHSVLLLPSQDTALNFPTGDITLAFCESCGFITNLAYNPAIQEYSIGYEATQAYSPTFNAFANRLANRLVEDYDLHDKDIIEIGCGQGEFLTQLCDLGGNRGVGFDPAYHQNKDEFDSNNQINYISDFYSEKYTGYQADFICCKMTLEHIHPPIDLVRTVRRSLGAHSDTTVFFQVPDIKRILEEFAFWDIYYEHCSYFSLGTLARLFRRSGFDVVNIAREYENQYLMIEARAGEGMIGKIFEAEDDLTLLKQAVSHFAASVPNQIERLRQNLHDFTAAGKKVVIWGAGSKGVSLLTTLNIRSQIKYAVDINPNKYGTYMAGTGQEIVSPEFLIQYQPDMVVVMNPIYTKEIEQSIAQLDIDTKILPITHKW